MSIKPSCTLKDFDQVMPGSLILADIWRDDFKAYGIKSVYQDKSYLLVLGPALPKEFISTMTIEITNTKVLDYGQDYEIRLSAKPDVYRFTPSRETNHTDLIIITEEKQYIRSTWPKSGSRDRPCYIDIDTWEILPNLGSSDKVSVSAWQLGLILDDDNTDWIIEFPNATREQ